MTNNRLGYVKYFDKEGEPTHSSFYPSDIKMLEWDVYATHQLRPDSEIEYYKLINNFLIQIRKPAIKLKG